MAVLVEELRMADLARGRPVVFDKVDVVVAHNRAGAFVVDMPANDRNWELIQLDAAGNLAPVGLVVDWDGVYTAVLLAEDWGLRRTVDDGRVVETLTLVGSDMLSLLANRIAWPNPAAAWSGQSTTPATYTGPAETVIKDIVSANVVTAAETTRRVPLLTVATDAGRGGTATYKVAPPDPAATTGISAVTIDRSLMDMVRAVAAQTPIGVQVTLGDGELVLDCYVPRDLSEAAVFAGELGNLPEVALDVAAPVANTVLTQSRVAGANWTTGTGTGFSDPWRRVEQYLDQTATDTAADVNAARSQAVADGVGQIRLAATVVDLPRLRFGGDAAGVQGYGAGDVVTLDVRDGATYSDVVSQVQLVADATGETYTETVTPTVGTPDDAAETTMPARLSSRLRRLERAVRRGV